MIEVPFAKHALASCGCQVLKESEKEVILWLEGFSSVFSVEKRKGKLRLYTERSAAQRTLADKLSKVPADV
jgi:hypothetical protein